MAKRLSVALLFLSSSVIFAQTATQPIEFKPDAEFPVQVKHSVNARKSHAGDSLEFMTVQAVLAGHGLVIPENSTIYGHVVFAQPLEQGKRSILRIAIDQVKWKHQTAPMKAIISGIGRRRITVRGTPELQPTFLEGTSIVSNTNPSPTTYLFSREHDVVLHGGTLLVLKYIPDESTVAEQH